MSRLSLSLRPSETLTGHVRARCPAMLFAVDGVEVETLRVDVDNPVVPIADGSCDALTCPLGFEVVIDEEAWLAECARMLASGATIDLAFPAEGPFAWLDAQNIYRYMVDILKRGDEPDLTRPTGWHRHYRAEDVRGLLNDAGFADVRIQRTGTGLVEIPLLALMLWRNFLRRDRHAERELFPLRTRLVTLDRRLPLPGIGWHLVVTATRLAAVPDDPSHDHPNTPARDIGSE